MLAACTLQPQGPPVPDLQGPAPPGSGPSDPTPRPPVLFCVRPRSADGVLYWQLLV